MTTTTMILPEGRQRYFNNDKTPCAGGKLYTYAAGTVTPKVAYQDEAGTAPHANPIILDANGEAVIFWSGAYKVDLKQANNVQVSGYPVDNIKTDPAGIWGVFSAFLSSSGASLIGFIQNAVNAVATTIQRKLRERVSVFDFMTDAEIADVQSRTGAVDVTTALQRARDHIASNRTKLVFPPGVYRYSTSPNWAIREAEIEFDGDVRLRYTGSGVAVRFDADAADAVVFTAGFCYGTRFGWGNKPIIEAPTTSSHGILVRSMQRAKIGARVRGCGSSSAGMRVEFAVCTEFDVTVSGNFDGWYQGVKPQWGYFLTRRNAGETTSYCTFLNPVVEGPTIGCQLDYTLGNVFLGGTFEACSQYGVYSAPTAAQDRFYGTDFEVNTLSDIYDNGTSLAFIDCDTYTFLNLGAQSRNATVRGGRHSRILSDTGSLRATIRDVVFNRFNDGSVLTDGGTGTLIENARNGGTGTTYLTGVQAVGAVNILNNALGVTSITVTGARIGDFCMVAFDGGTIGAGIMWGVVNSANLVTAYLFNNTGVTLSLAAGNWRATVFRR